MPAIASLVSKMPSGLGVALVAFMMVLLAGGLVTIIGASVRGSWIAFRPGLLPAGRQRSAAWITMGASSLVVGALIVLGFRWWNLDESEYLRHVYKPLILAAKIDRSRMSLSLTDPGWIQFRKTDDFIPDHGHLMHLFVIRMPAMDRMWHLHPELKEGSTFDLDLPNIPAGQLQAARRRRAYERFCRNAGDGRGPAGSPRPQPQRR